MDMDIGWFRRSLMVTLGLVACGPASSGNGSADGDGDGDGDDTVGTSVDTGVGTTGASTTVASTTDGTGSTTTPTTWPDPPWCGLPPPDDASPPAGCESPQPILQPGGEPSGCVQCSGGFMHRASIEACMYPAELVGDCNLGGGTGSETGDAFGECVTDADCDAAPHGYCNLGFFGDFCECNYGCETDADCGDGMVCGCFGADARCIPAHCTSDADCGDYLCALYGEVLACHGAFDTCHSGVDCPDGECPVCQYSATNCAWACEPDAGTCTIGRPFLVEGAARQASVVARADWSAALEPAPVDLAPTARERLARYWIEVALAEHASVPAFARFALQLAALGAPAHLLADTAAAMGDEIEHARLAFALARRYGGIAVGPAALPIDGALAQSCDVLDIAVLAVREACIGETLAAIEAAAALAGATDPHVCGVLRRIADDELRHAALGWRFVAWVIARTDAHGRARLHGAFARAVADADASVGEHVAEPELRAHGMLDGRERSAVRREALRDVVTPIVGALLDPTAARTTAVAA